MSKAKLYIGTQGVFGGNFSKYQSKGCVVVAIDGQPYDATRITFDAFSGAGDSYSLRDETSVHVADQKGSIFQGTITEFMQVLKFGVEIRDFGKAIDNAKNNKK